MTPSLLRLRTNGITLHVAAAGPHDAPLVLLLHGFPEFWYGWHRLIGPLAAAGFRVVAPDQRGYNLSDKPAGRAAYALDVLAADVLGLARALGRERFCVVGHDWGGMVAWHLAAQHPQHIERAVLLNTPHPATFGAFAATHPTQLLRSWYFGFFQLPLLPESVLSALGFAAMRATLVSSARPDTFSTADLEQYRQAWAQPGALTAMINWYRALSGPSLLVRTGRVGVPLRLIWGEGDAFLDQRLADAALAQCDQGELVRLAQATHWLHHEQPERVSGLIAEFLGARPPG